MRNAPWETHLQERAPGPCGEYQEGLGDSIYDGGPLRSTPYPLSLGRGGVQTLRVSITTDLPSETLHPRPPSLPTRRWQWEFHVDPPGTIVDTYTCASVNVRVCAGMFVLKRVLELDDHPTPSPLDPL